MMTTTTLTDADVLTARVIASAIQTVRRPDETTEEAIARWSASTPREARTALLAEHRAAIERAEADEAARVIAEAAEVRAKARAAILADVATACETLQGLLEKLPSEPGHHALLVALDQRRRAS